MNLNAEEKLQKYTEFNNSSDIGGIEYIPTSETTDETPFNFRSTVPPIATAFNSLFKPNYTSVKSLETTELIKPTVEEALLEPEDTSVVTRRGGEFLSLKGGAAKIAAEIDGLKIPNDDKYFLKVLARRESTFNPNAKIKSKGKTYRGLYQFGDDALGAIGMNPKDYDSDTKNQHLAALKFGEKNIKGFEQYIGKKVKGVTVTKAGMMAAAHLGGRGGLINLLQKGKAAKDELGTSTLDYLKMFEH